MDVNSLNLKCRLSAVLLICRYVSPQRENCVGSTALYNCVSVQILTDLTVS